MAATRSKEGTATNAEEDTTCNTEKPTQDGSTEPGESEKTTKRRRKRKPVDPTSTRRSQRERRKRVCDDEYEADNMDLYKIKKCDWRRTNNWTIEEKQWLLEAVKRYGQTDLNKISRCIPTKKTNEVKEYMDRLRLRNKEKALPDHDFNIKAPIECWLEEMETLTSNTTDYSYTLAQVLSLIQAYEPRELQHNTKSADYSAIYQFLVSLLRGHTPDQVRPVDAAVILDLLESLVKELQVMDTRVQRWVMKEKMRLLSPLVVGADRKKWLEGVRKALFNEFEIPEELKETPKNTAASSHKKSQSPNSASNAQPQRPAAAPRTATLTRPAAQGSAQKTSATVTAASPAVSRASAATSSHTSSGPRTTLTTTTLAPPTVLKSIAKMINKAKSTHEKEGIKLTLAQPSTLQITTTLTQPRSQPKTTSALQTSNADTADSDATGVADVIKQEPEKVYQYTLTESGELEVIPLKKEPEEKKQSTSKQATPPEYVIDAQAVSPDQMVGTQAMPPDQVIDAQASPSEKNTATPDNQATLPDQVTDIHATPPDQMIDTQTSQSEKSTATSDNQATPPDQVNDSQAMPPDQMTDTQTGQSEGNTATPDPVNLNTNQKAADRKGDAANTTESAPSNEARSRLTETSRRSTASVVQHDLYSINPLCIPIPLLNPKYKPI